MVSRRQQTVEEFENELEDMVDGAPLPGTARHQDFEVNQIVHDQDIRLMYDRRTGVSSRMKVYEGNATLEKQLQKIDSDPQSPHYGKRIYTLSSPEQRPELFYGRAVKGSTPCMLNENHPRFAEFRAMGFGTCKRNDLPNEQEADRHAKIAHQRAYPAVKALDEKREKDAQQNTMNALLERLVRSETAVPASEFPCAVEGCQYTGRTAHALSIHVGSAHKE